MISLQLKGWFFNAVMHHFFIDFKITHLMQRGNDQVDNWPTAMIINVDVYYVD